MPNILLNKMLLPELIQENATVEKLTNAVVEMLSNKNSWLNINNTLLALRNILGNGSVANNASKEILRDVLK